MERAERLVLLAIGILVSPILLPVLWLVFALSVVTVGQRFFKVWMQASSRDSRLKLRMRHNYRPRRTRGQYSFGTRLRASKYREGSLREQRVRRIRERASAKSWFSSRTSD